MKAIVSFYVAVLAGSFLLALRQTKAVEVSPRTGSAQIKATAKMARFAASTTNLKTRAQTPAAPQSTASHANAGREELSPAFQVSSDPRDQMWLSVANGVVTIHGSVATDDLAQKLVKQYAHISGVRQVRNELTVRNHDPKIADEVREALSHDPATHAGSIAVTVFDGIVFLSGAVSSEEESTRAEELARTSPGVIRVNNGLRTPAIRNYIRSTAIRTNPRTR
jgi:hyperosmotically inducible protein